jgi:phage I-like protein
MDEIRPASSTPPALSRHAAAHAFELTGATPPEWVHLLPAGTFFGRDKRGPYTLNVPEVLASFAANAAPIPIDYEHQSEFAKENGQPAPAMGWIDTIESRADGIWGHARWTPRGRDYLTAGEYRFLSPVFEHDKSGNIKAIVSAALINTPNLHLTALARRARQPIPPGEIMSNTLQEKIRAAFGLAPQAAEPECVAALDKLAATLASPEVAAMRKTLALPDTACAADILLAAHGRAIHATREGHDLLLAEHARIAGEYTAMQARLENERVDREVNAAISGGKIPPAERERAVALCKKDPDAFRAMFAAAPTLLQPTSLHGRDAIQKPAVHPLLADVEARRKQFKE